MKGTISMAVKYHCRKCGKRFLDWGAEKLGYKCPECGDEELVRLGAGDDKAVRKPSLKRKPRRLMPSTAPDEANLLGEDLDEIEPEETIVETTDSIFLDADDDDTRTDVAIEEVIVPDDLAEEEPTDVEVVDDLGFDAGTQVEVEVDEAPMADADDWSK